MNKFVLTILGCDRPGIVAEVSEVLSAYRCNIEDLTQTVLQTEFAAIFIFSTSLDSINDLKKSLSNRFQPLGLSVHIKEMTQVCQVMKKTDPFVAVATGKDRTGQIAALSGVMRDFGCNITAIKAVNKSHLYPDEIVIMIEMDVPLHTAVSSLRQSLDKTSAKLGLECSLQHKDIFESIHRV